MSLALVVDALEALHIPLCYAIPHHVPRVEVRALAHGISGGVIVQKFHRGCRDGVRLVKRNQRAAFVGQELERMQVGRRNNRFAGAQRVRQSARDNLGFVFVRSDVNVRRPDKFNHLLRIYKAIPKNHVGLDSQVAREVLQRNAIFFTLPPQDMRMRYAGNHVHDVGVVRQDFRQGPDDVLYAFIGREQPKGEQNIFALGSESIFIETGIREGQIRDTVRNQVNFVGGKPNSIGKFSRLMEQEIIPMLRKQNGFQDELTVFNPGEGSVTSISVWLNASNAEY